MKRIHVIQHVSYEGPGVITNWANNRAYELKTTYVKKMENFPNPEEFDLLVIMGGPMSVNDEEKLPWLINEKKLVRNSILAGKKIVGICLGAQMIAGALGQKIFKIQQSEIGWFDIKFNRKNIKGTPFYDTTELLNVYHWHGETFDLPEGSRLIASSEACTNQIFMIGDNVIGLQCHWEMQKEDIETLAEKCKSELGHGKYVIDIDEMIVGTEQCSELNDYLFTILDRLMD